ncbi:zinc-binding oxidoreductase CipB [Xylariaceae sp. FL0016]|nr:zinc-binding oxidoreductase CipB [Xylariaceae sp. FL0016]
MTAPAPQNRAAYHPSSNAPGLSVQPAPYPRPGPHDLVLRNAAVALNPIDYIMQTRGSLVLPGITYPFVLGSDVAGTVVEVGSAVTRFRPGDRACGYAAGSDPKCRSRTGSGHGAKDQSRGNGNAEGGFQLYTVVAEDAASPVPESITLAQAATLPMGVLTAACGLFDKAQLGLRLPRTPATADGEKPRSGFGGQDQGRSGGREVVLIWGGSTSVGCNAIQLASAAGYDVVTTCSPRNFDLVRSLGAAHAFDYGSGVAVVVDDIVAAIGSRRVAGALAIGAQSATRCMDVLAGCQGRKFVSMVTFPMPEDPNAGILYSVLVYVVGNIGLIIKSLRTGVKRGLAISTSILHNDVGKAIWADYLPEALQRKCYVAAPEPMVVGSGLENIQQGLELLKKGVSARKVVVDLSGES